MLETVCWLIQEMATERDEQRAAFIFAGAEFRLDGHKYCVEHVGRDEQNRLMLQARKEGASMKDFVEVTPEEAEQELLTVREVARILRVDETTVRRWIKDNVLAVVTLPTRGLRHVYRVRKSTLDALLNSKAVARG